MQLNPDCVRDLMLTLEKYLQFTEALEAPILLFNELLMLSPVSSHTKQDVAYTTLKLIEANYISAHVTEADDSFLEAAYFSITYSGHQFLENIRNPDVWQETKSKARKIGSYALNILSQIAAGIITARINN